MTVWRFLLLFIISFLSLVSFAVISFDDQMLLSLSREHGPIENSTAMAFIITGVLALFIFYKNKDKVWSYFAILMFAAWARELDWHKEWTHSSIFKSRFYTNVEVPIFEKAIGFFVIFVLLYTVFKLSKYSMEWIKNVFKFDPMAWCLGFGLAGVVLGKTIDSMARIFPFTKEYHDNNYAILGFLEENLELMGASFFVLICIVKLYQLRMK